MQIQDHVFIVTGAASGLGAEVASDLVRRGGKVLLADLAVEAGEQIAQALGDAAFFVKTDVCDAESAQEAVSAAVQHFGGLHGLVNCAGVAPAEKILGRDGPHRLESFQKVVSINLIGSFNMLRLAAQAIVQTDQRQANPPAVAGVIINTASVAAFEGQVGQAAYAASKGAVVSMTLPAARELARNRIRVMTVAPGIMATPMLLAMPQEVQDSLNKSVPFPVRMGMPSEFARLVADIVENDYLNGEVIRIDGAIRMSGK
ncbi:MAG: SDR family NAD(P)-dependent oxidoreductase [Burkholderiaceae bacterium]